MRELDQAVMLKPFPLLGAICLSVTSVQANEMSQVKAPEDWLISACAKSEGNKTLCSLLKYYYMAYYQIGLLCRMRSQEKIKPNLFETYVLSITEAMKTSSNKLEEELFELGYRDAIMTTPPCSNYL